MAAALDITTTFLQLADAETEPELLTNLRVQKLLYYAQGWSLALREKPLFHEDLEAWRYGPVVPPVYHLYKVFGQRPLNDGHTPATALLNVDDNAFVERIWQTHRGYSANALVNMTHREKSWLEARRGLCPDERGGATMSLGTLRDCFREKLREAEVPGVDPEHVWEAEAEFRRGGGRSLADIRGRRAG